jgi:hypothetical protein
MTPKEKAQELVNKMCNIEERFGSVGIYEGKECALIAVDEILSVIWINLDVYSILFYSILLHS